MAKSTKKVQDEAAPVAQDARFEMVHITMIEPDPNQPRKHIDEDKLAELRESIRTRGVLQPILVRPHESNVGYMVVCGERRYTAFKQLWQTDTTQCLIPCIVREMTDAEALELQIIENLHRNDITPIEEALAYKQVMTSGNVTAEALADKIGKTKKYIHQRLSLLNLIQELQYMVDGGDLTIGKALKLARVPEALQRELLDTDQLDDIEYVLRNEVNKLANASFDAADHNLLPGVGSCLSCPFNSGNKPMLFDDLSEPVCTNSSCFGKKHEAGRAAKLKQQLAARPGAIPVSAYKSKDVAALSQVLTADGLPDVEIVSFSSIIEAPEAPPATFEEYWEEDHWNEELSEADPEEIEKAKKDYAKLLEDHEKEVQEFNERLADPSTKVGVSAFGSSAGQLVIIDENSQSSSSNGYSPEPRFALSQKRNRLALQINDAIKKESLNRISQYEPVLSREALVCSLLFSNLYDELKVDAINKFNLLNATISTEELHELECYHGEDLMKAITKLSINQWAKVCAEYFIQARTYNTSGLGSLTGHTMRLVAADCGIDVERLVGEMQEKFDEENKDLIAQCEALPQSETE